jgi:hypothetical protein
MKLYIQVEEGVALNHPALEENLVQAFGEVPSNWEPFERIQMPEVGLYQLLDPTDPVYEKVNGSWQDVWKIRSMTEAEKFQKQQAVIDELRSRPQADNYKDWYLDEETCTMVPPVPRPPNDPEKVALGVYTMWCGVESAWKEASPYPMDNKEYRFNFTEWSWQEVVAE